jgi:hypothetical protein
MTAIGESICWAASRCLDEPAVSHISHPLDRGVATPGLMVLLLLADSLAASVAELIYGLAAPRGTAIKRQTLALLP